MGFTKCVNFYIQHGGDEVEQLQGHFLKIPNYSVSESEKGRQK